MHAQKSGRLIVVCLTSSGKYFMHIYCEKKYIIINPICKVDQLGWMVGIRKTAEKETIFCTERVSHKKNY